jgi:hypothetical protein
MRGRFVGTAPDSATTYDEEALRVIDTTTDPATTIDARFEVRAPPATLDTWLWNRPLVEQIEVLGDAPASARFEEIIRRGVQ